MTEGDMFGDSVYQSGDPVDDTDDLDPMESLTSDDPDEAMQTGYNPPDREPYNLRHLQTASERSRGESLDQRLAEEEPDVTVEDEPDLGVEDESSSTIEDEPDADADDPDQADVQPRAGRLVAPDEGLDADRESDAIASDVGPAGYASSAEEAAIHIIDGDDDNEKD